MHLPFAGAPRPSLEEHESRLRTLELVVDSLVEDEAPFYLERRLEELEARVAARSLELRARLDRIEAELRRRASWAS